jgi:hypothetical protein
LHGRLDERQRGEVRAALLAVRRSYATFFEDATTAGPGYNKHHGSVDAAPFGIMALALLDDVPEAAGWLDLAIHKHVDQPMVYPVVTAEPEEGVLGFRVQTMGR